LNSMAKVENVVMVTAATALVGYYTYTRLKKKEEEVNVVLFFPDHTIDIFDKNNMGDKIFKTISNLAIDESSSMARMLSFIRSAEKTIDLCLMIFTCNEFAREVLTCRKRGVKVRLVFDYSNVGVSGCQLRNMREGGVFVRGRKQPFLMHHKFAIIDSKLLINGSFNWTGTAVMGNNENVVITNNKNVVNSFNKEYNKLWLKHAPP